MCPAFRCAGGLALGTGCALDCTSTLLKKVNVF